MFAIRDVGITISGSRLLRIGHKAPDGNWYKVSVEVTEDELRKALAKLDEEGNQ